VFGLLSAVVSVVLFFSVVVPGAAAVRHTTHRKSCRANLLRIGQALQQYHDEHGSYPPAFLADDKGVPQHSWRVMILPQLGEHALYRQYHFQEPWDSPHNLAIASRMPAVFRCPADPDAALQNDTSYMVVVGPRTPFPPKGQTTKQNQALWDPLAETLLVVEVAGSGVGWTSPNDLQAEQLRLVVNPGRNASKSISSNHPKGVNALFADGQVRWLSDMVPQELLSAALTRDGHEPFDWVQLEAE
jgi:prepilin-type processing-associated H-X9-DG protein